MDTRQLGEVLITREEIENRLQEMAEEISQDYQDKELVIISILKSSLYFTADLTRLIDCPLKLDFLEISRYPEQDNSGVVRVTRDLDFSIAGKDVLIIESIVNTGLTHTYLLKNLKPRQPESLNICTLLDNNSKRLVQLPLRYRGFEVEDTFVVGYGLDYKEKYRHLPYIVKYKK